MNFNLFDIFRYATKRSILLGVGDAIEEIGLPPDDASRDKIIGFLRNDVDNETSVRQISSRNASASTKKLGRSLNDIADKKAS